MHFEGAGGMMIELFGPPGVGKTTFALALATRLRQRGCDVELAVSYRPAEIAPAPSAKVREASQILDVARRLFRPAREIFHAVRHWSNPSPEAMTASTLLRLLPPKSMFWSLRLRQYMLRLSRTWNTAHPDGWLMIYDQAFVQAVCSLALLARVADRARLARALETIPKPDLLVQLDAPRQLLEARLVDRARRQSRMEQWLEFDLATNLRSIDVVEELRALLLQQGQAITRLHSEDWHSLGEAVTEIEHAVRPVDNARSRSLNHVTASYPIHEPSDA